MSDDKLEIAQHLVEKERNYTSWLPEDTPTTVIAVMGVLVAGVATAAYFYIKTRK